MPQPLTRRSLCSAIAAASPSFGPACIRYGIELPARLVLKIADA